MARVELDVTGYAEMVENALQAQADQLQAAFDRVLALSTDKPLDDVKSLLREEIYTTFGTNIDDPELTSYAEILASGRAIGVRRGQDV